MNAPRKTSLDAIALVTLVSCCAPPASAATLKPPV
jgi:hypothetical protein